MIQVNKHSRAAALMKEGFVQAQVEQLGYTREQAEKNFEDFMSGKKEILKSV